MAKTLAGKVLAGGEARDLTGMYFVLKLRLKSTNSALGNVNDSAAISPSHQIDLCNL